MNGFSRTLSRDAAAPLPRKPPFGAEPVVHIVAVFSSALLAQFVSATANLILNVGNGILALH